MILARMDEGGKLAWLALTIATFWAAWPLGLALLVFLAASGRLRAWRHEAAGLSNRWLNTRGTAWGTGRFGGGSGGAAAWAPFSGGSRSGNAAFDAYRDAEMSRLEEEEREFKAFLDRLRKARDKAEFDQFMADRRRGTPDGQTVEPAGS